MPLTSANFESRNFQLINDDTLQVKPTIGSLAFSLLFVMIVLAIGALWVASTFTEFEGPHAFPVQLIGLLIAVAVKDRSNRRKRLNSHVEVQVNLCTSDGERHNAFVTQKAEKADDLGNQLSQIFLGYLQW